MALLGSEVGDALTTLKPIQERLQLCAAALVHQLDAALARIWILNEQDKCWKCGPALDYTPIPTASAAGYPLGKYKIGRIAQKARLRFSNNVAAEPDVDDQEWVRQPWLGQALSVIP